jgi:diguanylate cyclase (GGDEF)-like protein
MWTINVRSPSTAPLEFVIKQGKNTLGRKPDNDIIISDESASRNHAEIYCIDNILVINDLHSRNGTFVNRERIKGPCTLHPNDLIRIGQHEVRVFYRDEKEGANLVNALSGTRPLTREVFLEAVDQSAVLLYEVGNRLTSILDLSVAIQEISKLMKISMGADKAEIILEDKFDRLGEFGFPTSIAHQAIDNKSVVIIPDLSAQTEPSPSKSTILLQIRSILCVPVLIENKVVALIYVYKTDPAARPFDSDDVQTAVAISYQTALTIQRANLLERSLILEQKVKTDSLTGLYNRDYFLELAEHELQRARRFDHVLTIAMMDIDLLKKVNDTYGHLTGDQMLKEIAERCKKNVRDIDLLGRYGGDEFVFLLVESDSVSSKKIAERIRQAIASVPVKTDQGALEITVSIGLATYNDHSQTLSGLLNDADLALYEAKNAGRNLVEVAT